MDLVEYLSKILLIIDKYNSYKKNDFHKKIINALRIYYLSFDSVFITKKILSNFNYSDIYISDNEKKHIENFGWTLDDNYLNDVYISAIKTNLLFDCWFVFQSSIKKQLPKNNNLYINSYKTIIESLGNNNMLIKNINLKLDSGDIKKKKGVEIDFISPTVVLEMVCKLVDVFNSNES